MSDDVRKVKALMPGGGVVEHWAKRVRFTGVDLDFVLWLHTGRWYVSELLTGHVLVAGVADPGDAIDCAAREVRLRGGAAIRRQLVRHPRLN